MKKISLVTLTLIVLVVTCVTLLVNSFTRDINKEKNKYRAEVGKEVILEKDTLTIIDYSSIKETFTLSDGREVDASLVLNKDIK